MITPQMLILSSINEQYKYDSPVDVMYLNRKDYTLISSEADRLGELACSDDILMMDDVYGNPFVDNTQVCNDKMIEISWVAAAILNRIREAYKVYRKFSEASQAKDSIENEDLGLDSVVLRIEGNPKYIYVYVYNVMEAKGMPYRAKINKLVELYTAIIGHSGVYEDTKRNQRMISRLELQSTTQFWQGLIMTDLLKHGISGVVVTPEDIQNVGEELARLGFYGFVNPLKMYMDFAGSRVNRKVGVNIDPDAIAFLDKVVRSGGVA